MSTISGLSSAMHLAAGSLATHSIGMQVTSHNIANVNTADFHPQHATYATGPHGIGVELESVRKENPQVGAYPQEIQRIIGGSTPSGTELAREFPHMLLTQHGFQANAATIRTSDEMLGTLLDTVA